MFSKKSILALVLVAGTVTTVSNAFAQTADAPARPADLVMVSARLIKDPIAPKFRVSIRNQGLGVAGGSHLMIKVHDRALGMLSNEAPVAWAIAYVAPLGAGETRTWEFPTGIGVQVRLGAATAGQILYFSAQADCHNQVPEFGIAGMAELNNQFRFNSLQ